MTSNGLQYTTHEGASKLVPLDTVRLIRRLTAEDRQRAQESLNERRGVEIDRNDSISASSSPTNRLALRGRRSPRFRTRAFHWSISAVTVTCRHPTSPARRNSRRMTRSG